MVDARITFLVVKQRKPANSNETEKDFSGCRVYLVIFHFFFFNRFYICTCILRPRIHFICTVKSNFNVLACQKEIVNFSER